MITVEPAVAARLLLRAAENVGHDFHGNQYSQYGSRPKLNPVTFFHGTSTAALAAIKKEGLRPVAGKGADAWAAANRWDNHIIDEVKTEISGRKSSVYVTSDLRTANQFAAYAQDINPGSQAVVLRVDIPEEGLSAVKFDEISDDRMRAYRYNGTIPPAWIRGKVTNTKGGFEALVGAKTIYVVVVADGELRTAEGAGHDFHGNQWTSGSFGLPPASQDPLPGKKYHYHATHVNNVTSIVENGLILKQHSQNPISLSPHLDSVHTWAGLIGHPDEQTAVFRTSRAGIPLERHAPGEYDRFDPGAENATYKSIPADRLEVYHNGEWKPVKVKALGDISRHDFHGNQWTIGGNETEVVYHGTVSTVIDKILKNGILPSNAFEASGGFNVPDVIAYASEDRSQAESYAVYKARQQGVQPVIFEVHVPKEAALQRDGVVVAREEGFKPEWIKAIYEPDAKGKMQRRGLEATNGVVVYVVILVSSEQRSAAQRETILHTTADSFIPKLQVAVRYAFAQGRKALLAAPNDHNKAARIVHDSLLEVLPTTLLKVLVAGGNAGLGLLDGRLLKVAGGSGSGNFGHAGRPGEVGGSGEGSVYFHGTSERALEKIRQEGLISSDELVGYGREHHVYMTPDRELAERYARNHEALNQQDLYTAMIVEIHVPADHLHEVTLAKAQPADEHLHAVTFPRRIPPEWIGKAYILKKDGGWREAEASGAATHYAVIFIKHDIRTAEGIGHDFHGNQWTEGGGILTNVVVQPIGSYSTTIKSDQGFISIARHDAIDATHSVDGKAHGVEFSINKVEVKEQNRRQGYGKALYEEALKHAITGGAKGLTSVLRNSQADRVWNAFRREGRVETKGDNSELLLPRARSLASIKITFNASDPKAARWARDHAAELAQDLSDTTRQNIKDAVEESVSGDGSRQDILAAVGDSARAELIARTETMIAVHEGQRQGWDQAIDKGLLTGDEQVEWIATSGACLICDELDGELRDLDGEYPDPGGEGPPQHPNCRCTEGIAG